MCTSSSVSYGPNSNQYTNASELVKTNKTQNQLQNPPLTCNLGPQDHTLKEANSMTFFPGSNQYESKSSKLSVTYIVTRNIVWNENMYVTAKHLRWKYFLDFLFQKECLCGTHNCLIDNR